MDMTTDPNKAFLELLASPYGAHLYSRVTLERVASLIRGSYPKGKDADPAILKTLRAADNEVARAIRLSIETDAYNAILYRAMFEKEPEAPPPPPPPPDRGWKVKPKRPQPLSPAPVTHADAF